uniref:Retrovirus-related Pol polyprotein from transposon TNT 1-94 n=1 Tax=Tanacetum cinerariifolium TaxID=118510 RepID=A0A6L2P1H7_TANCI|nr:retrovirus-related Pol polyprotein from transposon TNT 1-94 [Tanacetum cinerariifolium]
MSPIPVIKNRTEKSPAIPKPCSDKKSDSSTKQLLLTLMEESVNTMDLMTITLTTVSSTLGDQGLPTGNQNLLKSGFIKGTNLCENVCAGLPQELVRKRKHHRASFKTKRSFSIIKSLHLLHMDLFGHVKSQTISRNKYTLVIVDEYSRYTCVFCLKKKSDAVDYIMSFIRKMKNLNEVRVKELRSDNGTKFRNHKLEEFCDEKGISQNFSSPCTPEQNGVVERRNRTLIKAARTLLNSAKLPKQFWEEAINTACYTQNRSIIVKRHGKTLYDVFRGSSLDISYFYMFGCPAHIHNHRDHLGKFDEKADDGFFLGYSPVAKAFRVWLREKHIELVNIIGEPLAVITTRSRIRDSDVASASECLYVNFLSEMKPKKLIEALEEEWIIAMQEELNQFERNKEGIDYEETFAHVARMEAIRIFLAYAAYMGFMVYQMDVKSAFLNEKISKKVYVQQPPGVESSEYPNHVCKLDKALYGLKQASRAWYETLSKFLIQHKFFTGPDESGISVNETLFRGMIGSLMYLTASRPDIQFFTCLCARYQANPKESNLVANEYLMRLLDTWRKVCWSAKKQSYVAMSSAEDEYVAAAGCCAQELAG